MLERDGSGRPGRTLLKRACHVFQRVLCEYMDLGLSRVISTKVRPCHQIIIIWSWHYGWFMCWKPWDRRQGGRKNLARLMLWSHVQGKDGC